MKDVIRMKQALIPTCSMCSNFDSLRPVCKLTQEYRHFMDTEHAEGCQKKGDFVRYLHVIPDVYNYFGRDEEAPSNWKPDYSRVPKDGNGLDLIVQTRRGLERAIPADPSVKLEADLLLGVVARIYTFQGQRELIYELGVERAQKEAKKYGVALTVLPEEISATGQEEYVREYEQRERLYERRKESLWLRKDANKGWD